MRKTTTAGAAPRARCGAGAGGSFIRWGADGLREVQGRAVVPHEQVAGTIAVGVLEFRADGVELQAAYQAVGTLGLHAVDGDHRAGRRVEPLAPGDGVTPRERAPRRRGQPLRGLLGDRLQGMLPVLPAADDLPRARVSMDSDERIDLPPGLLVERLVGRLYVGDERLPRPAPAPRGNRASSSRWGPPPPRSRCARRRRRSGTPPARSLRPRFPPWT